jgi:short-chain fatty acids transporter
LNREAQPPAASPRPPAASVAAPIEAPLARMGGALAAFCERVFPDAFVIALLAVLFAFGLGLGLGESPTRLVRAFGDSFWSLIPFTMQMALVIVGGFVVASAPAVERLIERLAAVPKTPRGAVAFTALFAMLASMLSWGLSLVFTGLLVRALARRLDRLDYRALGAAAYLGLGSVWALGLSSSAALLQASRASIPAALLPVTGVLPLSQTVFLWQNLLLAATLIAVSVLIAWWSHPDPSRARTAASMGIRFEEPSAKGAAATAPAAGAGTPAARADEWPWLSPLVAILLFAYLLLLVRDRGVVAALDLNSFNMAFFAAGLLLHGRPRSFLRAVGRAVPATSGVLVQFPLYAGIFGLIANTAIAAALASFFVRLTTRATFPLVVGLYSATLGLLVPSGGGKWVLEAPYVMAAAAQYHIHLGWTVQIYNAAEALPNLINPFWMLPLMGILNVRARDLAGYSVLQLLVHLPLVLGLSWLLTWTLPYVPPVIPSP